MFDSNHKVEVRGIGIRDVTKRRFYLCGAVFFSFSSKVIDRNLLMRFFGLDGSGVESAPNRTASPENAARTKPAKKVVCAFYLPK
jgi:hypothetical protein